MSNRDPILNKKIDLYKLILAKDSMRNALIATKTAESEMFNTNHLLHNSSMYVAIVSYGRVFMEMKPFGALSTTWHKQARAFDTETHEIIMRARHQFVAHGDLGGRKVTIIPVSPSLGSYTNLAENEEYYGFQVTNTISTGHYPYSAAQQLFNHLHNKLSQAVFRSMKDIYGLQLSSQPFELFTPAEIANFEKQTK